MTCKVQILLVFPQSEHWLHFLVLKVIGWFSLLPPMFSQLPQSSQFFQSQLNHNNKVCPLLLYQSQCFSVLQLPKKWSEILRKLRSFELQLPICWPGHVSWLQTSLRDSEHRLQWHLKHKVHVSCPLWLVNFASLLFKIIALKRLLPSNKSQIFSI